MYQAQNYREAATQVRGGDHRVSGVPRSGDGVLLPRQQLRQPLQAGAQGRGRQRRVPHQGDRKLQDCRPSARRDADIKKLALQYLVNAYGPDKLDDPTQAEPIVQRMMQLDPSDTDELLRARQDLRGCRRTSTRLRRMLNKAREVKPKEAAVYQQLAGFYQRQGEFDKLIAAVQQRAELEPNNPEAHYAVATYYWDEAYRNTRLNEAQKREYVEERSDGRRQGAAAERRLRRGAHLPRPAAPHRSRHGEGRRHGRRHCSPKPRSCRRRRSR